MLARIVRDGNSVCGRRWVLFWGGITGCMDVDGVWTVIDRPFERFVEGGGWCCCCCW